MSDLDELEYLAVELDGDRLVNAARILSAFPAISSDLRALKAENERLRGELAEIAKGEGAFSRDPLTHASNTIENMTDIARRALEANDEQ